MRVAFTFDQLIICGGLIVPALYVRELRRRGIDAGIYAKQPNNGVLDFYTDAVYPYEKLSEFTDDDVTINCWWRMGETDMHYKGRKIQFVQGNDIAGDVGDDYKQDNLAFRRDARWEILAVSQYAGDWIGREFTVIPNGIDDRFFVHLGVERDISILYEGNQEENKGWREAIDILGNID